MTELPYEWREKGRYQNPYDDRNAAYVVMTELLMRIVEDDKFSESWFDLIHSDKLTKFSDMWYEMVQKGTFSAFNHLGDVKDSECFVNDHLIPDPITGMPTPAHEWGHIFCPKCRQKL